MMLRNSLTKQGQRMAHSLMCSINFLALFGEMCFSTAGPMVGFPMILAELAEIKNCGVSSRSMTARTGQFFDRYCGFFSGLHLAVCRHDHVHASSGIHHKLSPALVLTQPGVPILAGRVECL